jgi:DNA-binding IclR family transcriptional regulator
MPALASEVPNSIVLLCGLYGEKVLCTHRNGAETILAGGRRVSILRARGVPLPLFQGAASLAILAFLPLHRARTLYLARAAEIAAAGLGADWASFRAAMSGFRKQGHVTTLGRYHRDLAAVAVPVRSKNGAQVLGSLTRIMARTEFADGDALAGAMQAAATLIAAPRERT